MNKNDKLKKAAAILVLVLIVCTFVSLIINLILKAAPTVILAHLFCLMIIPCMFYAFRLFINSLNNRKNR